MTRPMPPAPAVTTTRRPFAEMSMAPMIAPSPPAFLQFQFPELADRLGPEGVVHLGPRQLLEARLAIDRTGRGQVRVRPEHQLRVASRPRECDALLHQPPSQPRAPGGRVDEKQAQLRSRLVFFYDKDTPHPAAGLFRDPATFACRIEVLQEILDDLRDQRLEGRAPAILLV